MNIWVIKKSNFDLENMLSEMLSVFTRIDILAREVIEIRSGIELE